MRGFEITLLWPALDHDVLPDVPPDVEEIIPVNIASSIVRFTLDF